MSSSSKFIPAEGVSKKLKTVVIILTVVTLLAFIALFTKIATKSPVSKKTVVKSSINTIELSNEYQAVGTRLMNAGLKEQAIDQFIKVWNLQSLASLERATSAQMVGRLYAELGNCQEAMVWLYRAEVADAGKKLTFQPLIDSCMAKVRSNLSGR